MTIRKLTNELKQVIKIEKSKLHEVEFRLKKQKVAMDNPKYFRLLSKASKLQNLLSSLEKQKKFVAWYESKQLIIGLKSKVKLVSVKIGAIIWVDAKNYIDLIGKTIGDTVSLYNGQFLVAGIY